MIRFKEKEVNLLIVAENKHKYNTYVKEVVDNVENLNPIYVTSTKDYKGIHSKNTFVINLGGSKELLSKASRFRIGSADYFRKLVEERVYNQNMHNRAMSWFVEKMGEKIDPNDLECPLDYFEDEGVIEFYVGTQHVGTATKQGNLYKPEFGIRGRGAAPASKEEVISRFEKKYS